MKNPLKYKTITKLIIKSVNKDCVLTDLEIEFKNIWFI